MTINRTTLNTGLGLGVLARPSVPGCCCATAVTRPPTMPMSLPTTRWLRRRFPASSVPWK
ncbi:hypothetical protein NMB32_01135 [Stenotrophomonas sp. CD2]|nr:hypothetical protein NMB32_01135 [Stenotrophomonas sp. CD2]